MLRVTVSAEFVANLEAARRALSHKLPGGELAEVLHEGLRAILANADRRRRGTGKKSSSSMPPAGSRYVPAAVRDEVWRRDDGQCAFIGRTGHGHGETKRGRRGASVADRDGAHDGLPGCRHRVDAGERGRRKSRLSEDFQGILQ